MHPGILAGHLLDCYNKDGSCSRSGAWEFDIKINFLKLCSVFINHARISRVAWMLGKLLNEPQSLIPNTTTEHLLMKTSQENLQFECLSDESWKKIKEKLSLVECTVLTVLSPGLLGEHVVSQHSFVRLWILLFLERDQGLWLWETKSRFECAVCNEQSFVETLSAQRVPCCSLCLTLAWQVNWSTSPVHEKT